MGKVSSFEELALEGLRDTYDAENQVLAAFPEMIAAATSPKLKAAFEKHQKETQGQVARLEQIFEKMGESPGGVQCHAARGLIKEAKDHIKETERGPLLDAALIGAAQRFEHYEIASYGTARTFAEQLGDPEAVKLLDASLAEEKTTDESLTELAISTVNKKAAQQ
jgi:ferritin-like metal-binding protein YciE